MAVTGGQLRAVPLEVLVFGPSRTHAEGHRRVAIRDLLRSRNPIDSVEFPEDLIERDPDLKAAARARSTYEVERLLVGDADAVVALLIDDPRATGAVTELAQFLAEEHLRKKFFVIEPATIRALTDRDRPPYTFELLNSLHPSQRLEYAPAELGSPNIDREIDEWLLGGRLRQMRSRR